MLYHQYTAGLRALASIQGLDYDYVHCFFDWPFCQSLTEEVFQFFLFEWDLK